MPTTDDKVGEQARQWHESPPDAQQTQDASALYPPLRDGDDDNLFRDNAQSKHHRKTDEGRETEQLTQYFQLALLIVFHLRENGLRHAIEHVGDEVMPHLVPLVGLREVAHHAHGVELSQNIGEEIVVDDAEDIGDDQLATETYHLTDGCEINRQGGVPACEGEAKHRHAAHVGDGLRSNAPERIATGCHRYPYDARNQNGADGDDGGLFHLQIAKQIGAWSNVKARNHETYEKITR